ncbi:MAG: hypothetical protein EOO08_13145 [Chitinophagaceae bacterium]|nr:MAG: hypothetical protein EOO08_13145 [Chitinophagaceae bacterium]
MLAPDKDVVNQFLVNLLSSYQSVTLAAISLQQARFFPLQPPPDWMKSLETDLGNAQDTATDWLIGKGPNVIALVPQYFVSYSNSMQVLASNIRNATSKEQAIRYLQWLQKHIAAIPEDVKTQQKTLNAFADTFQPYQQKIQTALTAAQAAIKTDQDKVKDLSDRINQLYRDISAETEKASQGMSGVATSGASLSFALLSWSFAVATAASPAFPFIGIAVAVGGLTYGAIVNAINTAKITENLKTIRDLQVSLVGENQAIAIVQNLTQILQNVNDSVKGITKALDVTPIWRDESNKVDEAIAALTVYSGNDFKSLPALSTLDKAVEAWKAVSAAAINVQKSAMGMSSGGVIEFNAQTMEPTPLVAMYN